jgi:hypothetical protein
MDEPPSVEETFTLSMPDTVDLVYTNYLRDMFLVVSREGENYDFLVLNREHRKTLERMAANKNHDGIWETWRPLAGKLTAGGHWQSYVKAGNGLLTGEDGGEVKDRLVAYSVRRPEFFARFKSVTILGAKLEETLLFRHFVRAGVRFVEDAMISRKLRHRGQPNASLVKILYGYRRGWSKNARDKDDGKRLKAYVAAVKARLNGTEFRLAGQQGHSGFVVPGLRGKAVGELPSRPQYVPGL